jgi:hypothetical protein
MAQVRLQCPSVGGPVRQRVARGMAQHVRMHLEGHLAAIPARSTNFCKPDTVKGAPRSLTNMKGDSASRLSARNARSSSPSNGCVLVCPPLALRRCRVPDANSTSWPQSSEARRPCRKASRSIVLSR